MDPELKRMLEETKALAKDNHRMLRAIRRGQWIGFFTKIAFWVLIILVPLYFYQEHVVPLFEKLSTAPASAATDILGLPSSAELQKLLESYKAGF